MSHRVLADAVLVLHAGFVAFVLGGLLAIVLGNLRGWQRVNTIGFRAAHLAAIAIVVAQAWLGMECPLTTLESWLRTRAGETGYAHDFLAHWLHQMLFFRAPAWVFTLAYSAFALAVLAVWWVYPPRTRPRR
jgi:hypothetical protein